MNEQQQAVASGWEMSLFAGRADMLSKGDLILSLCFENM